MKTVSQLGSGKAPVGTTAYMARAQHLLQCRSGVQKGEFSSSYVFFSFSPLHTASWLMMMILLFGHVAEDWLNPAVVVEAFEARALRMAVACAKNLSKFENQEQGILS